MKKVIISLGIYIFSTTSALAVDLENKDSQTYKVRIIESGSTKEVSIEAGQALTNVCNKTGCQIDVEGIGSINATNSTDKFVIDEGKITIAGEPQSL